jgi:DNA modification methylase
MTATFNLLLGDCLERLKELPDNSIDSIVTDPPYGLSKQPDMVEVLTHWMAGEDYKHNSKGFMGKEWDSFVPGPSIWKECMRVLKPGGHMVAFFGTRTYDIGALAIRLAGFEIRNQLAWVFGCLSTDTECLTKRGWVQYDDILETDEVCQWDSDTDTLSWTTPIKIHQYDFDGKMITLKNRNTDQLLTPNHRVYAKIKRHSRHDSPSKYEVVYAEDLQTRSASWQVNLPLASCLNEGLSISPDYAYLVGWWLTDAWVHGDGKACMFIQSKPKTLEKLRNAISKYNPSEYIKKSKNPNHSDEHTFYLTGDIANKLISEFPTRKLSWDVLDWNIEARQSLFDGLMDGDGSLKDESSMGKKNYSKAFWAKNPERRDVFMALAVSLGYRCHEDSKKNVVYLNTERSTTQLQNKHREERTHYTGKVWCLTVPTGAFVVRRNGRPFITGNSGFPKSLNVSKAIDKSSGAQGKRGSVVGKSGSKRNSMAGDFAGGEYHEYLPSTDAAKQWEGWGSDLKPAFEPIVLARKPLEGTVAQNVMKHGVGGINIDGCRVPSEGTHSSSERACTGSGHGTQKGNGIYNGTGGVITPPHDKGRFPANFIHDGSEEVVSLFPDSKGQIAPVKGNEPSHTGESGIYGTYGRTSFEKREETELSAARFFYCAKTSKKDRNEGTDHIPNKNNHTTVKPTALMEYLCRLITPPNGTILDPFMGSGSTGKAAMYEGFNFVGIELLEEHMTIAEARIEAARKDAYEISVGLKKPKKAVPTSDEPEAEITKFFE